MSDETERTIYLIDDSFLINQIDLIDHFEALRNVVILQFLEKDVEERKGRNNSIWPTIKEIIDTKDYSNFYYFYNENHEATTFSEEEIKTVLKGKSRKIKNKLKVLKAFGHYQAHCVDQEIVLLTDSEKDRK